MKTFRKIVKWFYIIGKMSESYFRWMVAQGEIASRCNLSRPIWSRPDTYIIFTSFLRVRYGLAHFIHLTHASLEILRDLLRKMVVLVRDICSKEGQRRKNYIRAWGFTFFLVTAEVWRNTALGHPSRGECCSKIQLRKIFNASPSVVPTDKKRIQRVPCILIVSQDTFFLNLIQT